MAAVAGVGVAVGEKKEEGETTPMSPSGQPKLKKVVPLPKTPRGKPHHFQVKTFQKPTKCHHCTSVMVGLVRQGMCCDECHYSCHFHCAEKVPYPCPTSTDKTMRPSGIDPKKGVGTACEGWVKVPKPGGVRKGWSRHYAMVCDFKLFLYELSSAQEKEKSVLVSIVTTVDMRDELFEVGSVQKSDVIHAPFKLLPNIFKVVASAYNASGPQFQLLILTESPTEQMRWVSVLRELKKALLQTEQPVRTIYTAKEVYDSSQLDFIRETTCAAVVDSERIVVGTEEGLYGVEIVDDVVLQVERDKRVYQVEVIPDEQLVVALSGKQRHVRLYPQAALDGQQLEGVVKMPDTKGAQLFAWGPIKDGSSNCLCVAIKKKIFIYELNKTRFKHRKVKEIGTQRETQWMGVFSGKLCVGHSSGFVLYPVHGEGQATSLIHKDDLSLGFVALNPMDAMCCIELDQKKEYLLCFNMLGVYVDAQGRRARRQELMWPSLPLSIAYSAPYVIVCSQNTVDVFDVVTAEWLQTLPQKRTHALCRDGSLVLWHGSDSPKLLFLKGAHLDDADAELCVPDGPVKERRPHFVDKRASKRKFSSNRHLTVSGASARAAISNPINFSHVQHVGPDSITNLVHQASDEDLYNPSVKSSRTMTGVPPPVRAKPPKRALSALVINSSSPTPSAISSLTNGPNDNVAVPRFPSDQQLHNENILQVNPTTGQFSMRRSSASSVSSLHYREAARSPSPSQSRSRERVRSEEPPPAYIPPPIGDQVDGRRSREGSVKAERQSNGASPPPYTFPPHDEWEDEGDAFKTEC
jgi:serine/threonine-protein kinase MRCK